MPKCRDYEANVSIVILHPVPRESYPDDQKEPLACRLCGTLGYVHFEKIEVDEIQPPAVFECWNCSIAARPDNPPKHPFIASSSPMIQHIDALIELAGLDKSEGATMTLIDLLDEAVCRAHQEIQESLAQGLSLDCRYIIAETLSNYKEQIAAKE